MREEAASATQSARLAQQSGDGPASEKGSANRIDLRQRQRHLRPILRLRPAPGVEARICAVGRIDQTTTGIPTTPR